MGLPRHRISSEKIERIIHLLKTTDMPAGLIARRVGVGKGLVVTINRETQARPMPGEPGFKFPNRHY